MSARLANSGCLDEGVVVAFLGGRLSEAERSLAERHVAACAACVDLMTYAAADIANGGGGSVPGRDGRPFVGRLTPGTKVDRYQVLGAIGRGGMGEVYAAYHPDLDRRIALKVVYAAGADGAERWGRLLREARAIARLSHPNVINVYDAGTLDGGIYIAMEFVDGETIDQWLRSAAPARSWREIVDVFLAAGRGLAAAHAAGVVHRDFKPQNVMVGRDGSVRVMDFGLARLAQEATDDERAARGAEGKAAVAAVAPASVTKTGAVLGTPAYMAPEQFQGAAVDARADQYSFCVALHEALYGARPTTSVQTHEQTAARPSLSNPPARLKAVVRRGLAGDRAKRYASMNDLLRTLERTRTPLRPQLFAAAGGLAAVLVLLGGWRVTRHAGVSCAVPSARLAAAWSGRDDARRQSIHRAFLASGRPTAETSWHRVSAALDEHVGKWSAMYLESCEATHVRGEQSAEVLDLRTSCLNESLDEVRALTDVLVIADTAAIARSSTVVRDVAPVSRCADLEVLRSAVPLPRDPTTLAAVQRLRSALRTVRAQGDLGRYWEAARSAEALRPEVEALAYEPLLAELLEVIGRGVSETDPTRAEQLSAEALVVAERVGDRVTAVKAATALSALIGRQPGRGLEAERWSKIAQAIVDGLKGNHNRLRGWIATDLGVLRATQGGYGEARTAFQQALALKEEAVGRDHPDVALTLLNLCEVCTRLGRFEEAVDAGNRAVAIVEKLADPDAGFAGMTYGNRGRAFFKLARYVEADADLTRSLQLFASDGTLWSRQSAEALHSLGELRFAQGQLAAAVSYLTRAIDIREKHEVDASLVADTRFALARALWSGGGELRRARALAVAARDAYATKQRPEAGVVAKWLKSHPSGRR